MENIVYKCKCKLSIGIYEQALYDIKIVKKEVLIEENFVTFYEVHKKRCLPFYKFILAKIIENTTELEKFITQNKFLSL